MTTSRFTRRSLMALALALVAALTNPARADLTFNVNVPIAGQATPQTIGSINASITHSAANGFAETGVFTFAPAYNTLDNCYQFRWFQIVTSIPDAVRTDPQLRFRDAAGDYTRTPVVPFVDPPAGGYQYQQANGGADNDPFYENTDPGNYAYPNYSARHTQNVNSRTDDAPGPQDVYFETYLVAYGGDIPANMFDVLAGYSWNTHLNAAGDLADPDPVRIMNVNVANLNTALGNSGFGAADRNQWTAVTNRPLTQATCPEPSSLALVAVGLACVGMVYRVRRPGRAAAGAARAGMR